MEREETGYSLVVDYEIELGELVRASNYDKVNKFFRPEEFHHLTKGKGKHELSVKLIQFKSPRSYIPIRGETVLEEFKQADLRPADIYELLTFGRQYPDIQKEFDIIELGSIWQFPFGDTYVVSLGSYDYKEKRSLELQIFYTNEYRCEGSWHYLCIPAKKFDFKEEFNGYYVIY